MRSLSTRLVLAFVLTSLAGVALAALLVRQLVVDQFDAYVQGQRSEAFVALASTYYAEHGTWDGVAAAVRAATARPNSPLQGPGPESSRDRLEFVLADAAGTIVLAPFRDTIGRLAPSEDLARGTPVTVGGQVVGTVIAPARPSFRNPAEEHYLARTDLALAAAGLVAMVVALGLGLVLARLITRPLRDLTTAARAIARGDLRQEVPVRSTDELGVLAMQFNAMSADLHHANELRRRMTADIAHDLRTPLTVIGGYMEALRDQTLRPTPERFAAIYDETQVLLRLVEDLHTLSQADAGELTLRRGRIAPARLLERVAATYADAAAGRAIALEVQAAPNLPEIDIDVEQMARAVSNLVRNALQHTPAGGHVTLAAGATPGGITLSVADTGAGISAEHLPHIFERFYRADESRQQATGGSGLGLAIVRSIVVAHSGQVQVASRPGAGATFTITLGAAPGR